MITSDVSVNNKVFKGTGVPTDTPKLLFEDNLPPPLHGSSTRTWVQFNPLVEGQGNGPFTFHQSSTKFGAWQPDEVFMLGWNLSEGGTNRVAGQPGIGTSYEQHYKPYHAGLGLTEKHDYYIKPTGEQVRLNSYTIDVASGDIDYYNTVNRSYTKSPVNGIVYHGIHLGGDNSIYENFTGSDFDFQWIHSSQGIMIDLKDKPFNLNGANYVSLPRIIAHKNYTEFDAEVYFKSWRVNFDGEIWAQKRLWVENIDLLQEIYMLKQRIDDLENRQEIRYK